MAEAAKKAQKAQKKATPVQDDGFRNNWAPTEKLMGVIMSELDFQKYIRLLWQDGDVVRGLALSGPVVKDNSQYAVWDYGMDEFNEFTEDTADERVYSDVLGAVSDMLTRAGKIKGKYLGWRMGMPCDFHDDEQDELWDGVWEATGVNPINKARREADEELNKDR